MPRLSDLLPVHSQAWLNAIQQYVSEMFDAAGDDKGCCRNHHVCDRHSYDIIDRRLPRWDLRALPK